MKFLKFKSIHFSLLTLISIIVFMTSCGKEAIIEENIIETAASEKENHIDYTRIGFSNNMLVFENVEHVHEVLEQIQTFKIKNEDIQKKFPEFTSFQSQYYLLRNKYSKEELKNKTNVFGYFEKDDEFILKPNIPISSGLALICNSEASIIVKNDIIKTTFNKNYIIDKKLLNNNQDIEYLIKNGQVKKVFNAQHSYLPNSELNRSNKKLETCTDYVRGQNRRLQAELGYFTHFLAVFAYADSNYEKKAGWWWDDITYNSCSVTLNVNRLAFDDVSNVSHTINNNDNLVEVSVFLGGILGSFHFEDYTDNMNSTHSANVTYSETHNLQCSNIY